MLDTLKFSILVALSFSATMLLGYAVASAVIWLHKRYLAHNESKRITRS